MTDARRAQQPLVLLNAVGKKSRWPSVLLLRVVHQESGTRRIESRHLPTEDNLSVGLGFSVYWVGKPAASRSRI